MKKTTCMRAAKVAVVALLCFQSISCSKKPDEKILTGNDKTNKVEAVGEGITALEDAVIVSPTYNSTAVLRNPLSGWVLYAGADDPTYWDRTYNVPGVGTVKALDYASACYIRTSWAKLNPSDGVYAWRDPNSTLGKVIRGAAERGLPIAFRIVVDGRDQGLNTPQFVFDAGATYYLENASFPLRRTPYPQDPVFKQYYAKLITELAVDFNDPKKCAFIDAYGLGKWGEAHNTIYENPTTSTGANTETLKAQVLNWITDLYTQKFTKVPLVINYHRLIGHPASWGAANANSITLLQNAINKGYSLRQDAFGMTDYYQSWERNFAASWKHKRPIIMEGGWITGGTHRYWIDPSGNYREGHPEDVRLGEFNASAVAAVNMMDFRVGEVTSWFQNSFTLVQRFIAEGGYRLYPDQVALPNTIATGSAATLSHRWVNMGWGYCPNNIPQWNYKYKVAFAILDAAGAVKKLFIDNNSEPSLWIKDHPTTYNFTTAAVDLPLGTYTWAVAIIDKTDSNKPGIQLATNGIVTNGWLKLGDLQVTAPIGQSLKLKGPNNLFVSGENGQTAMMCDRATASTWETFTIVDAGGGKVALKSMNKYVSSENGATTGITCNKTTISDWEKFDWIVNANGTISLRGNNGRYISSENGQSVMKCNRTTNSGWESFTLVN